LGKHQEQHVFLSKTSLTLLQKSSDFQLPMHFQLLMVLAVPDLDKNPEFCSTDLSKKEEFLYTSNFTL